nr:MAG TPA: hypothetical protein [Caudoviricetes sp.]
MNGAQSLTETDTLRASYRPTHPSAFCARGQALSSTGTKSSATPCGAKASEWAFGFPCATRHAT